MAIVDRIWFYTNDKRSQESQDTMDVYVKLHPSGEVKLFVPVPKAFYESILRMARAAAEKHEAEMQAQLLGELK